MKTLTHVVLGTLTAAVLGFGFLSTAFADDGCNGCNAQAKETCITQTAQAAGHEGQMPMHSMHDQVMQADTPMGKVDADGKAIGPTMGRVFTAEALYTCPMHNQVVTDNPDARCPLCSMKLVKMSDEQVDELRASHPQGCPMNPIVEKGSDTALKCDICGMTLSEIPRPKEAVGK